MTNEEAAKMLIAKVECMKRETSGIDSDCNDRHCDNCDLCYAQGTMGEQKEALRMAISALEKQDVPDTNVGDMISRQAAISIPLTPKELRKYQTCNLDDAYNEGWGDYQACVSQLPSVHPEYEPVKAEDFANNVREYALQFYGMARL